MTKACIFCGGPGPFSKEHVLPEWTAKLLKIKKVNVTITRQGLAQTKWASVGSFGAKIGPVCKKLCNSGWMSDLENLARPILSTLILPDRPVALSPDEQVIVASWLWKLAVVMDATILGGISQLGAADGRTTQGYLMTLFIRRFCAQLLCVREVRGVNLSTVSHYQFKGAEALIWPEQDGDVPWPRPAAALDDALFQKWHTRWNTPKSQDALNP